MCGVQPTQPSKVKRCMSNQGGKAAATWAVQHFHLPPCNPKKTFCSRLDGRKKKKKKKGNLVWFKYWKSAICINLCSSAVFLPSRSSCKWQHTADLWSTDPANHRLHRTGCFLSFSAAQRTGQAHPAGTVPAVQTEHTINSTVSAPLNLFTIFPSSEISDVKQIWNVHSC